MITFDGNQPTWLIGWGYRPFLVIHAFVTTLYRPTPSTLTDNYGPSAMDDVGYLAFTNQDTFAYVDVLFPSGNTWYRPSQPMAAAAVR